MAGYRHRAGSKGVEMKWKPENYPALSPYLICSDGDALIEFAREAFSGVRQFAQAVHQLPERQHAHVLAGSRQCVSSSASSLPMIALAATACRSSDMRTPVPMSTISLRSCVW